VLKALIGFLVLASAFANTVVTSRAGVYSCTCGNGTPCTVSCECTGSISCGHSKCASRCAACAGNGTKEVALSLGTSLYETSYIGSKGNYSSENLVDDFTEMLEGAKGLKFVGEEAQLGPDKQTYVVLRHTRGELRQTVVFPQDFLGVTDEFLGDIKEAAPGIAQTMQEALKPFEKSLLEK